MLKDHIIQAVNRLSEVVSRNPFSNHENLARAEIIDGDGSITLDTTPHVVCFVEQGDRIVIDFNHFAQSQLQAEDPNYQQQTELVRIETPLTYCPNPQELPVAVPVPGDVSVNCSSVVNQPALNTNAWTAVFNGAHAVITHPAMKMAAPWALTWFAGPYCALAARELFPFAYGLTVGAVPGVWNPLYWISYVPAREHAAATAYNYGPKAIAITSNAIQTTRVAFDTVRDGVSYLRDLVNQRQQIRSANVTPNRQDIQTSDTTQLEPRLAL